MKKTFFLGFIALSCGLSSLSAQVTIGADNAPQPFSVLELISGNDKGLRLPQLTQLQRDTLDGTTASAGGSASMIASAAAFATGKTNTAMGLTIFNITTKCVETWNGAQWIEKCAPPVPPSAPLAGAHTLCTGATVADLTATAEPAHTLNWYNVATGGSPLALSTALIGGNYYVSQTNSYGLESSRTTVMVVIVSAVPVQPSEITGSTSVCPSATGLVYSVTNVAGVTYNWSLPSGWTPTAGAGTNSITVTAGTTGGTITVTPSNGCGNGTVSTLAVTVANCSAAVPTSGAGITTFTNVMYDFQHQTLEAYKGSGGGDPTTFQWQYSTSTADASFVNISGAPNSAFYTIPADFAISYLAGSSHSATLYFRCLLSNPATPTPVKTPNMDILFINTSTAGYGTDANGVKYLTIQKGESGVEKGGTIKMALLNLGQSENDDAGDLGDFYQWGRIADGHEHTVWSKNSSHANQILPMTGGGATSAVVARSASQVYTAEGQIPNNADGAGYYGNFITNSGDWGEQNSNSNDRWGNANGGTPASASNRNPTWINTVNNPCPTTGGWKVPSRWQIWDTFNGNGSDAPASFSGPWNAPTGTGNNNNWAWRAATNNAIGGALLTNASGEIVFLPVSGYRDRSDGTLLNASAFGGYWSSTFNGTTYAYNLSFSSGNVDAGNGNTINGYGFSVRCLSE
jgi:hypothetical protein